MEDYESRINKMALQSGIFMVILIGALMLMGGLGVLMGIQISQLAVTAATRQSLATAQVQAAVPTPTAGVEQALDVDPARTVAGARAGLRLGDVSAPVQIAMFEDPQCGYCKLLEQTAMPSVITDYVKAGKVALVYRHFPILGAESDQMSLGLECAGQQNRFWDFHARVFDSESASSAAMTQWATDLGLDPVAFARCLSAPETHQAVAADAALGRELRVLGTPTLFVNGHVLPGAVPYDVLKGVIDERLLAASAARTEVVR